MQEVDIEACIIFCVNIANLVGVVNRFYLHGDVMFIHCCFVLINRINNTVGEVNLYYHIYKSNIKTAERKRCC